MAQKFENIKPEAAQENKLPPKREGVPSILKQKQEARAKLVETYSKYQTEKGKNPAWKGPLDSMFKQIQKYDSEILSIQDGSEAILRKNVLAKHAEIAAKSVGVVSGAPGVKVSPEYIAQLQAKQAAEGMPELPELSAETVGADVVRAGLHFGAAPDMAKSVPKNIQTRLASTMREHSGMPSSRIGGGKSAESLATADNQTAEERFFGNTAEGETVITSDMVPEVPANHTEDVAEESMEDVTSELLGSTADRSRIAARRSMGLGSALTFPKNIEPANENMEEPQEEYMGANPEQARALLGKNKVSDRLRSHQGLYTSPLREPANAAADHVSAEVRYLNDVRKVREEAKANKKSLGSRFLSFFRGDKAA